VEHNALKNFGKAIERLPVTEEVTREAAVLARPFCLSRRGIDAAEYPIAAKALIIDADLLSRNVRHYPMVEVPALRIEMHGRTE
jgi:hypothetical protein